MDRVLPGRRPPVIDCLWSEAGAPTIEIHAPLLPVRLQGECRVKSKHFGTSYVCSRCEAATRLTALIQFPSTNR